MSSEAPTEEPVVAAPVESAPATDVGAAQVDGSGEPGNGSALLDTEANVEVKLADLQADPNNPLFSANSFEELKM
jgi:ATP-dependent RNA helicase DDX19/DBP5